MPESTSQSVRSGVRRRAQTSPHPANDDRTQGTCSYYPADLGGCRAPRSCFDCLNSELEKEPDGCMVNEVGRCVSIQGNYDNSLDFRLEFPAANTTYCEANDVLFSADLLTGGGFMYGTKGCVFVGVCEVPNWIYVVGYVVFWCVAIAIILTLVATLAMVITIHHHRKGRTEELQRQRTIVIGEPIASSPSSKTGKSGTQLLNLIGWEAMRADLIEKERQDVQSRVCIQPCPVIDSNLPSFSPSAHYLQLVGAEPSAPVMSPINSSAPRFPDC
ncbi:uncharacterized protein PITG_10679 [Phytophthora infestans T30-4]|uniref:Uncharacterized protein n=1 Tax=Phytophthora infestans (strain T30-4) TaxID=403677 RepID=D0NGU9_PHYIT|nr:uncharacterized protein PITG_10679 [Phytophthora infestans T30-4]EEY58588.1 conserved hypothetical protein [Phytophthora infestans T30-4]|eukprot:XP_002901532.1 conserved hypothetical protein [Phytophthora infestans T30-4]